MFGDRLSAIGDRLPATGYRQSGISAQDQCLSSAVGPQNETGTRATSTSDESAGSVPGPPTALPVAPLPLDDGDGRVSRTAGQRSSGTRRASRAKAPAARSPSAAQPRAGSRAGSRATAQRHARRRARAGSAGDGSGRAGRPAHRCARPVPSHHRGEPCARARPVVLDPSLGDVGAAVAEALQPVIEVDVFTGEQALGEPAGVEHACA